MADGKYKRWLEAEGEALRAELQAKADHRPGIVQHARKLREEADQLFSEAMDEMNEDVSKALAKPVRKFYDK